MSSLVDIVRYILVCVCVLRWFSLTIYIHSLYVDMKMGSMISSHSEAMKPKDGATGRSRGYFILQKDTQRTLTCKLSADQKSWPNISHLFTHVLPRTLKEANPSNVMEVLTVIARNLPPELHSLIVLEQQDENLKRFSELIASTKLYSLLLEVLKDPVLNENLTNLEMTPPKPELIALLLMSAPSQLFKELSPELRSQIKSLRSMEWLPLEISKEVTQIRYQMLTLAKQCSCNRDSLMFES